MKKIVIINGHPNNNSFNFALAEAYKKGAAHILTTLDQPDWYYRLMFGKPSVNQLKKSTLEFCGVKPVKVSYFGPVKSSDAATRKKWLEKAEKSGMEQR